MLKIKRYNLSNDSIHDSEKAIKYKLNQTLVDLLNEQNDTIKHLRGKIANLLKQQLIEKDKEITILKEVIDKNKTGKFTSENVCNAISEFYEPLVKNMIIAELEKLLKKTQTLNVMVQSGHYINQKKVNVVFKDVIDQQITKLKGEK